MSAYAAYFSAVLLVSAAGLLLCSSLSSKTRWLIVVILLAAAVLLPDSGDNLLMWLAGATGELSIPGMLLLANYILRKQTGTDFLGPGARRQLYLLALVSGLVLYPATLGLSIIDPYAAGYGMGLNLVVSGLVAVYLLVRQYKLALVFALVVIAAETGVFGSVNTWDYLVDPLLWLASPVLLLLLYFCSKNTRVR